MKPEPDREYFAAFLDLHDRVALVVGGGGVAERKAEALLRSGAQVRVVAPRLRERLAAWAREGAIEHRARAYEASDLDGVALAIAATDDPRVNATVAREATERGVLVNVADFPPASSFIMPALVDRGAVQIAISTAGASPVLAKRIAAMVESAVPQAVGPLADFFARYREQAQARLPDVAARRAFWQRVIDGPIAQAVLDGRDAEARALIERALRGDG
ncbi:MAG TPA: bifunctional precorrin-2 dehydrogenase/sirohydrochlorin ferrochelatase [Usitatibacter sp.]|nr:bifunctional precorrin-2 dehydrogenase/sirohydrochlorin ferrochelatase [Usitatibacter sp.]